MDLRDDSTGLGGNSTGPRGEVHWSDPTPLESARATPLDLTRLHWTFTHESSGVRLQLHSTSPDSTGPSLTSPLESASSSTGARAEVQWSAQKNRVDSSGATPVEVGNSCRVGNSLYRPFLKEMQREENPS